MNAARAHDPAEIRRRSARHVVVRTGPNGYNDCIAAGVCAEKSAADCDDKKACTVDACESKKGCVHDATACGG